MLVKHDIRELRAEFKRKNPASMRLEKLFITHDENDSEEDKTRKEEEVQRLLHTGGSGRK